MKSAPASMAAVYTALMSLSAVFHTLTRGPLGIATVFEPRRHETIAHRGRGFSKRPFQR